MTHWILEFRKIYLVNSLFFFLSINHQSLNYCYYSEWKNLFGAKNQVHSWIHFFYYNFFSTSVFVITDVRILWFYTNPFPSSIGWALFRCVDSWKELGLCENLDRMSSLKWMTFMLINCLCVFWFVYGFVHGIDFLNGERTLNIRYILPAFSFGIFSFIKIVCVSFTVFKYSPQCSQ